MDAKTKDELVAKMCRINREIEELAEDAGRFIADDLSTRPGKTFFLPLKDCTLPPEGDDTVRLFYLDEDGRVAAETDVADVYFWHLLPNQWRIYLFECYTDNIEAAGRDIAE